MKIGRILLHCYLQQILLLHFLDRKDLVLTALETLSTGRPFLVTQNSGFGETLQNVLPQSTPSAVWILKNHISGLRLFKVSAKQ